MSRDIKLEGRQALRGSPAALEEKEEGEKKIVLDLDLPF